MQNSRDYFMKKQFLFAMLLVTTTFAFTSGFPAADPVDEEGCKVGGCEIYKNMNLQNIARSLWGDPDREFVEGDGLKLTLRLIAERDELQVLGAQLTLRLAQQVFEFESEQARKEQEHFDAIEALMTEHANDKAVLLAQLKRAAKRVDKVAVGSVNSKSKFGLPGAWMKK